MDREKVIDGLERAKEVIEAWIPMFEQHNSPFTIDCAIELLKEQEAVVRCKDCKYGEPWGVLIGCGTTKGFGITHDPDWFCADGERKEGR